jgi:hypothetical protein
VAEGGGDINLYLGQRSASDDSLELAEVDSPFQSGVWISLDFDWPVVLAIDFLSSSDDDLVSISSAFPLRYNTWVDTFELDLGVRKYWGQDRFLPYLGGGLAWVQMDVKQIQSGDFGVPGSEYSDLVLDDKDSGAGMWACGGFLFRATEKLNLGVDIRYTDSDVKLDVIGVSADLKIDSGGIFYGAMIGYHW